MRFIHSNAEVIKEDNPYKKVELVGRTCYKSEDKITDTSYIKFVKGLIQRKHYAMLEHGWVYYKVTADHPLIEAFTLNLPFADIRLISEPEIAGALNQYTYHVGLSLSHLYNDRYSGVPYIPFFRRLTECLYLPEGESMAEDSKTEQTGLPEIAITPNQNPSEYADMHFTVKFICDRGVSHELVRHRCAVAQESTRYCNYAKDKFGGGDIQFVYPHEFDSWPELVQDIWKDCCKSSENGYNLMIESGMTPQQARAVLPNSLKTECILTMNYDQWRHFFDLRMRGTTGSPHPDMQEVAKIANQVLEEEYWVSF